jgi:hypothetical protein
MQIHAAKNQKPAGGPHQRALGRRPGPLVIASPRIAPGSRNFKIAASATTTIRPRGTTVNYSGFLSPLSTA